MNRLGAAIEPRHFELLKKFGRTPQIRSITDPQKAELWKRMCHIERVAEVPLRDVKIAWRQHVSGKSKDSGLSIQALPGGMHTLLGVTYKGTVLAAHPVKTRSLIKKLLEILHTSQPDPEIFLQEVIALCPPLPDPRKKNSDTA